MMDNYLFDRRRIERSQWALGQSCLAIHGVSAAPWSCPCFDVQLVARVETICLPSVLFEVRFKSAPDLFWISRKGHPAMNLWRRLINTSQRI
jgi:hypothetical protein